MSKIYLYLILIGLCFYSQNIAFALTDAEIDAYYDAQKIQLQLETNAKNKAVEDKLQDDIQGIKDKLESDKWEIYKRVYGDQFEMVKPFLPESNPNPLEHAGYMRNMPRATALNAINNIRAINPELADQILFIYEGKQMPQAQIIPPTPKIQEYKELKTSSLKNETEDLEVKKNSINEANSESIQFEEKTKEVETAPNESFVQKIGKFFIRLMFWK